MNFYKRFLIASLFLILSIHLNAQTIQLTDTEKEWIKNNPVITVQNEKDWEPFNYNTNNIPTGHSVDYMKLLVSKVGLELKFLQGYSWKEYLEMLKNNKIDVLVNIAKTPQREKFYSYTKEYHKVLSSLYVLEENMGKYSSLKDLEGKTISVVQGMVGESVLRKNYPKINIYPVKTSLDALKAVIYGKAEGVVQSNALGNRLIQKYKFINLKPIFEINDSKFDMHLHLATTKSNTILRDILQKGMLQISSAERIELEQKHFRTTDKTRVALSQKEKDWIKKHPKIILGSDDTWAPFVIKNTQGEIVGIDQSFIDLLNQKLGINLQLQTGQWSKMVQLAKEQQIDGLSTSAPLESRKEFFNFTEPYMDIYKYIFTRTNENIELKNLAQLQGKKVGVQKEISFDKKILSSIQNIEIVETNSVRDSINQLLTKKIDAFIASTEVFPVLQDDVIGGVALSYTITKPKLNLVFSIRKDWPELVTILNKGLQSFTQEERQKIFLRWLGITQIKNPIEETIYNHLSQKEKEWIKNTPKITLGFTDSYAPEVIKQSSGEYGGMLFELISLLENVSGLNIDLEIGDWKKIQEKALMGELDGIALGVANEQRNKYLRFSHPLYEMESAFYYKTKEPIPSLEVIKRKRVVYIKGEIHAQRYIEQYKLQATQEVENAFEALSGVSQGKYDAALLPTTTGNYLVNIHFADTLSSLSFSNKSEIAIGIHKNQPELLSIINKAIKHIDPIKFNRLYASWFGKGISFPSNINYPMFTIDEFRYLAKKEHLTIGVLPFQAPLVIKKGENKEGIIPDYITLLATKLGKPVEFFPLASKEKLLEALQEGKIDAYIFNNPRSITHKSVTEPLVNIPLVLATKEGTPFFEGLVDANLKRLAIPKKMALKKQIQERYKHIKLVEVENAMGGLNALLSNKADAYICSPNVISYTLKSQGIPNVKISAITPYSVDMVIKTGENQPELLSLFNKAVKSITHLEHQKIRSKWRQVELQALPDYTYYFQIIAVLLIIAFGITLWVSWWNKRLRYEIKQKEIAQRDALDKERQLSTLLDNIPGMAYRANNEPTWPMIEVNQAAYALTGYTREEFISQSILYNDIIIESDRKRLWKAVQDALNQKTDYYIEYQIETKSGEIKWVWERGKALYAQTGELLWLEGLIVDNSAIKEIELNLQKEQNKVLEQKIILESIFDNAATFMVILNNHGDIVFFNLFAEEISGYKKEEVLGKNWFETFIPNSEQNDIKAVFKDIMKNIDQHNDHINPIKAKNGTLHYIRWRNSIYKQGEQEFLLGVGNDITDAMKLETLYRDLHTSMQDAYGMIDLNGKLTDVNEMACKLLGYTKEEFFSMNLQDITPEKWLDLDKQYHDELLRTKGCTEIFEKEFIRKDGTLMPAEVRICVIKNSAGEVEGYWGVVRDITERKKASEELIESNNLLIEAQKTAHIAHWSFNPKTGIPWWSQELYRIYDRDPNEGPLPYSEHPQLVHPDDWEWFDAVVQDTTQTGEPFNIILRIIRPDKSIRFINSICKPILDDQGNVLEMRGTIQDITELKQAEQFAKESEQKLRTLIDTIPDMVWMKDTQGVYKFANLKYQEFLELSEANIIGKTDYDLYEKTQADFYRDHDILAIKEGKPRSNEEDATYANGYVTLLETVKSPVFDSTGELIGVLGIGRDISELRKKEEMLISQSRSAAMGDMISMIAHQWKQPLSALSMVANNMKVDYELDALKAENIEKYYSDIDRQVQHLSNTIDDFRDFFKPNKKKQLVLVQNVIDDTLKIIDKSLENNNIELIKDFQDVGEISIFSNELFHILLNVVNNAKEALIHRGIDERKIFISTYRKNDNIYIEIEDNAGGIDEEIIDRVFEPYFTTKEELNGTGIGLYMAKTIIEKHFMGKIEVENTNNGAKFILVIPK